MTVVVPMRTVSKDITATIIVRGLRGFAFRMWLAIRVLKIAAWIMPVETSIEVKS